MKKTLVIGSVLFLLISAMLAFAQYTGSDIERKKAENLYPEPGPGELLIVDQLRETNSQLEEQTRLLAEQNRILIDTLNQIKKSPVTAAPAKQQ